MKRYACYFLFILCILTIPAALAYQNLDLLQHVMAHWTGESDLKEQIKGTLALAYLRLTRFPPQTAPFTPMRHTGLSPYGVNTFLEQEADPLKVEQSLQLIADAGFHWIRQEFPWEDIEISAKGDFWDHKWNVSAWEKYDRIVALAEAHGLEIIARLDNPPAWSRSVGNAEGWSMAPPDRYEDFGDFVYAVVSRYRGRIRYYQIWNEPNIYPEWGDQPADPAAYVELLRMAYRRAKEADPNAVIIAAGLAQTTEETPSEFGPRNMSDLLYLEKMYQAGVRGFFDIMGCQLYGLWTGPYDRRVSRDRTNFSRVELLREIMVRYGDADKPIWATEVGWNAIPQDSPAPPIYGRVSEETQAVYAIEAYRRAAREWPWMGVMNYWFFRRPSDAERDQAWYYFRLLEPDFTPLPVYDALAWLANEPPTMHIGYHQEDHWALNYVGDWRRIEDERAVLGAYALGHEGDRLTFYMEGTDLALVLRDAQHIKALRTRIDGRMVSPRLSWSAPSGVSIEQGSFVAILARGLADARHRVELEVVSGAIALDGILVWRTQPAWGLAVFVAFALGAAIVRIARAAASMSQEERKLS
ncbi:MAG: cellulase family glycosylhydrolase [Chloroflexi bacterium]|nr:cellulase family glycosylhydrolase [Chloroflexota bacterium]